MSKTKFSRRTFLKGSAAAAAIAAVGAGGVSLEAWRANTAEAQEPHEIRSAPSLCNGCSSKCGLIATVQDGRLWTLKGDENHPYSKGTICARSHGLAQMAYSKERVTQPLRKTATGEFEPISWDTAYAEIGEKVKHILDNEGPLALSIIQDPRPSGKYYSKRFINALGSPNYYTHTAACNLSKESGFLHAIGAQNYSVDFANAKMVVFIGRSYGDGIRPSSASSLAAAAERGCRIVIVDPRLNNSAIFANDWLPITPGTDLALLLGVAHVLIKEELYDKDFISEHSVGFEEFAEQIKDSSPEWAEKICGISADTITNLARDLAKAAPACAIEPSWRAAFGCAYKNSFETARAVAAVNALLGCWGQKGGALITSTPSAGELDKQAFPPVPKPEGKRVGDKEYPLTLSSTGTNTAVAAAALEGSMKGVFFYNSNALRGYGQPAVWREALAALDLSVCIDVQMSETALACDYVLPECTYLERLEVPEFIGGKKHYVGMRTQALDVIHPETKACDEIFAGLAEACGVGEYFQFSAEDLAAAELATVGVSIGDIKSSGTIELEDPQFAYGVPKFKTTSGKFEFSNDKVGEAGLNPVIGYIAPKVSPRSGEFHLIGGKQGIHSHTMTMNIDALNAISREYNLERIWMNADDAAHKGIEDGDLVEVSSSEYTGRVNVRTTQRLKPGVVYLPSHYGGSSPYQTKAYEYGIEYNNFVPFDFEPGTGSIMSQEVAVTVEKVGA